MDLKRDLRGSRSSRYLHLISHAIVSSSGTSRLFHRLKRPWFPSLLLTSWVWLVWIRSSCLCSIDGPRIMYRIPNTMGNYKGNQRASGRFRALAQDQDISSQIHWRDYRSNHRSEDKWISCCGISLWFLSTGQASPLCPHDLPGSRYCLRKGNLSQ